MTVGGDWLPGTRVLADMVAREEPVGTRELPLLTGAAEDLGLGVNAERVSVADEADTAAKSALSEPDDVDMLPEELPLLMEDPEARLMPAWPLNAAPIAPEENVKGRAEGKP